MEVMRYMRRLMEVLTLYGSLSPPDTAAWISAAGADYMKVDSCCGNQNHEAAFSDYRKWRNGLNATGRQIYFSLCGSNTWYAPVGASLGNSWRIAGDGTNWPALSNCINLNARLQKYAQPGAWNDPDLLQGTGIGSNDKKTNPRGCFDPTTMPQTQGCYQSEQQSRAQFSMWCVMSASLIISADVGQVSDYSLETWGNEEMIAVNQQFRAGGPFQGERLVGGDLVYNKANKTGSGHNVWGKLLPEGEFALVFISNENLPTDITCDEKYFGALLGTSHSSHYSVRDLWKHENIGTISEPFSLTAKQVPKHGGVSAYRLFPKN